jgi:hypothetical protein
MSPHPFQGGEFSVSSLLLQDTHGEQEVRRRAACVSKSDLQMLGQREGGREGEEAVEVGSIGSHSPGPMQKKDRIDLHTIHPNQLQHSFRGIRPIYSTIHS